MNRIYHTWDKWECYPAGFYEDKADKYPDATKEELEKMYGNFLSNHFKFKSALRRVVKEWKNSCEHYLSNENMNRIAWLGQAAACIELGIPSCYRGGYHQLTKEEQYNADLLALRYLNEWLVAHGEKKLTLEEAGSKTEANLY